jgi:hypothetical protein
MVCKPGYAPGTEEKNDPPLLGDLVFGYLVIAAAALVLLILLFVIGFSILDWAVNLLK